MQTELDSFLIEISALILAFKDEDGQPLVNKILDKTGMKGTGVSTITTSSRIMLEGFGIASQHHPSVQVASGDPQCIGSIRRHWQAHSDAIWCWALI